MEQKAVRNEFLCPKKTSFWPKNKESYSNGEEDEEIYDAQHAEFRRQAEALVALYGEGENGDVFIRRIKNNVLIDFEGIPLAFPRLIAKGKFIQVVSPGCQFRLEFRTEKRLTNNGKCTLTLEERPEDLVGGTFEEIEKLLDSSEWTPVKPVHVIQVRHSK
jgi:hypothetical protein